MVAVETEGEAAVRETKPCASEEVEQEVEAEVEEAMLATLDDVVNRS